MRSYLFHGFIRNVSYFPQLIPSAITYSLPDFDINQAKSFGVIRANDTEIAYSKWVSPKRTRSFPFARIYNTYNASKILTVIPVIKDEGRDGDLDRINFSTFSWMNLLNIYIVLGNYNHAEKNFRKGQSHKNKLSKQQFDNQAVQSQIREILAYKQSALHWNRSLFEEHLTQIVQKAISDYAEIAAKTGVKVHDHKGSKQWLLKIQQDFQEFKNLSNVGSQAASIRESKTIHEQEFLTSHSLKGVFYIQNYLGGEYHLTADEVFMDQDAGIITIQESKNSVQKPFPSQNDIKDGLFKLILFSNLDKLIYAGKETKFTCRLNLTGNQIAGRLEMPCSLSAIDAFIKQNPTLNKKNEQIYQLNLEAKANNIQIVIGGNQK